MKSRNLNPWCLMFLMSFASSIPIDSANAQTQPPQANPFAEGTKRVTLTPEQSRDLLAYVDQSQATLEQALSDAKGRDLSESSRIYLEAVKSVVLASDTAHPRSELLMRVILNQALALTYGIPNANGNGFESEGILARSGYQDLLPAILHASIRLALQYVDQDRQAAKSGSLLDLPYGKVAQARMILAQDWMRSIFEQSLAAYFGIEALQQWLNVMMSEDQQHQAKFAAEITEVQRAITRSDDIAINSGLKPEMIAGEQERLARITMRKVLAKMETKLGAVASLPGNPEMSFVRLGPVTFEMGSDPRKDSGHPADETRHQQTLSAFEIQTTDVTQAQWVKRMGFNPSRFKGDQRPVEQVNWFSSVAFANEESKANGLESCYVLNDCSGSAKEGTLQCSNVEFKLVTCRSFRLPTEAEWEYAARAGSSEAYSFGKDEAQLGEYAWYIGNAGGQTHDVATRKANAFGLFDMQGNVWQWVQDWYEDYSQNNVVDYAGPSSGSYRGIRGGSWSGVARYLRSGDRVNYTPADRYSFLGFRLVRTL